MRDMKESLCGHGLKRTRAGICLSCYAKRRRSLESPEQSAARLKKNLARNIAYPIEVRRDRECRYRFGISLQEKRDRIQRAGSSCEVCRGADIVVDHDHSTGLVRGILCRRCNACLGMALDRVYVLRGLADYLTRDKSR